MQKLEKPRNNFRGDINGLRALAVTSVVFYHFGVTGFSGGFVGVDVFFVISGFLMTKIIIGGLERSATNGNEDKFSIISFYISRATRIIPALLVLCMSLIASGWLFLTPIEYGALGKQAISTLGFFSNIEFARESGYFDAASHEKPLLHTWSLSVEWQFYLALPLILMAIWKIRPGRPAIVATLILGLLLSFLLSVIDSPSNQADAFYLLPTRAWEMLAGGLVYLLANPLRLSEQAQKNVEGSGFILIAASIGLFDAGSSWPSWRAAVPVLGTMLVLVAARQDSPWTINRAAQWLGNCSYSLYLWHWPLVVALVYLQRQHQVAAIGTGLALTLVFGWLSYRLIETPARTALARSPLWASAGTLLAATLLVMLPSRQIQSHQGFPERLPSQVNAIFSETNNMNPRRSECHSNGALPIPECTYGGAKLGAIVIGDSHAASVIRSIEKALPSQNLHVLDWTLAGCRIISGVKETSNPKDRCGEFTHNALKSHRALPKDAPLIIIHRTSVTFMGPNEPELAYRVPVPSSYLTAPYASRSAEYLQEMREGMIRTACEFAKTRPVYMLRPIPELKIDIPKAMGRELLLGHKREVSISLEEYHQRNAFAWETQDMAARRCGVKILDPLPYLCSDGRCKGAAGGRPIYLDDDHLSERGGSLLIPLFRQAFEGVTSPIESVDKRAPAGPTPGKA